MITPNSIEDFIITHKLPENFKGTADTWFKPLAKQLTQFQSRQQRQITVAINGCQGSGKSTLAASLAFFLTKHFNKTCLVFSLDDFYLTHQERIDLANKNHPLFATRGVPGTHDIALLRDRLNALHKQTPTTIPQFSKARDDRLDKQHWLPVDQPPEIIIIEGWCMGTPPQDESQLVEPINALEQEKDREGLWRHQVNERLKSDYAALFQQMDLWIMLKAPSFDCVYRWRREQEHKLAESLASSDNHAGLMSDETIEKFIQFYQRLTVHTLATLPNTVHFLYHMDNNRQIQKVTYPIEVSE